MEPLTETDRSKSIETLQFQESYNLNNHVGPTTDINAILRKQGSPLIILENRHSFPLSGNDDYTHIISSSLVTSNEDKKTALFQPPQSTLPKDISTLTITHSVTDNDLSVNINNSVTHLYWKQFLVIFLDMLLDLLLIISGGLGVYWSFLVLGLRLLKIIFFHKLTIIIVAVLSAIPVFAVTIHFCVNETVSTIYFVTGLILLNVAFVLLLLLDLFIMIFDDTTVSGIKYILHYPFKLIYYSMTVGCSKARSTLVQHDHLQKSLLSDTDQNCYNDNSSRSERNSSAKRKMSMLNDIQIDTVSND